MQTRLNTPLVHPAGPVNFPKTLMQVSDLFVSVIVCVELFVSIFQPQPLAADLRYATSPVKFVKHPGYVFGETTTGFAVM